MTLFPMEFDIVAVSPMNSNSPLSLQKLKKISDTFLAPATLNTTYRQVVRSAVKLSDAMYGSLYLFHQGRFLCVYSTVPKLLRTDPSANGISYQVYRKRKPEFVIRDDAFILLIPISYQRKSLGVLKLHFGRGAVVSKQKLLEILYLYTHTASMAIHTAVMYENLQEILKNRDMFISIAGHELKTPLTTIFGSAEIIRNKQSAGLVPSLRLSELIIAETKRMIGMVRELLTIEQIQSGRFQYEWKTVNIRKILAQVRSDAALMYPDRIISFNDNIGKVNPWVVCDEGKMIQVFANLINNAYKFSPPERAIHINLFDRANKIVVEIIDRGNGIPKKELANIFEHFYKAEGNMKNGLGLGLYVSKRIVRSHKGSITVQSQLKKGTKFTVSLPIYVK